MTVNGPINPSRMGNTLIHEHILVDFIGAEKIDPTRWDREEVIKKALPFLQEAKDAGCSTFVDCTPNFLGRDVGLLRKLSLQTGLNIITNTGYYGGSDNKFLPAHAFSETADHLAKRWIDEWKSGIDGTNVKPGFIKISVNSDALSDISKKLVQAAAETHLQTGLTIASHTGPAKAALEELEILQSMHVHPKAFIWVHAQNEKDWEQYKVAAGLGTWISLDGLNDENIDQYVSMLTFMKEANFLHRTLISHDAGWYDPVKPDGGNFRGYSTLFKKLIPALKRLKFDDADVKKLLQNNPREAFTIKVKKLEG